MNTAVRDLIKYNILRLGKLDLEKGENNKQNIS